MTLSIWVSNAMGANALNFIEHGAVFKSRTAQLSPIVPATTTNHIVYRGECKALMIQMTVLHVLLPLPDLPLQQLNFIPIGIIDKRHFAPCGECLAPIAGPDLESVFF